MSDAEVYKSIREDKRRKKEKNYDLMILWLENNSINYQLTKVYAVALLTSEKYQAYMSLSTAPTSKRKIRMKGKRTWHLVSATRIKKEFQR
jgi:hypothetical protein